MRAAHVILLWLCAGMSLADGDRAGRFDYYVLSMSWSPTWCALEGTARDAAQCDPEAGNGWILHGLWPQFHRGWPANCPTSLPPPSRGMTAAMADIMGSGGLAWHQWHKHGTCTGLSAAEYFARSREAFARVRKPGVFRQLREPVKLSARAVEDAFLRANPRWHRDMLTVTCRENRIQEARLCLSKTLQPVPCGQDVIRDCTLADAVLAPVPRSRRVQ